MDALMSDLDRQVSGIDCGKPDFSEDPEDHDPLNEWVIDCGDPECCMNFAPHFRSECYTPEMYEAYVVAMENECEAGGDHDWQTFREKYGEDADGNRGEWREYEGCAKCKRLKGEL